MYFYEGLTYQDLKDRARINRGPLSVNSYFYIDEPAQITDLKRLQDSDKSAARFIREFEQIIDILKEYRIEIAKRYGEISTMAYKDRLIINRYKAYSGGVTFTVTITRTYSDGTAQDILTEQYTGKERKKALDRFEELKKQHPGIEAEKDIEKGRWEK